MAVLEAQELVKTVGAGRGARRVLDGVELSVEADEVVAVLGRSGSGKSTLLHMLGGLDSPDAGIDRRRRGASSTGGAGGRAGADPAAAHRLRLPAVSADRGAERRSRTCCSPRGCRALPRAARAAPRELIDVLGLRAVAGHLPHELSGGEQQRFAIARALVNGPELVLADEPTGSLDAENGAAVLELLRGLRGRAVVIVTHEAEAAAIADRVTALARRSGSSRSDRRCGRGDAAAASGAARRGGAGRC